MGSSAAVLMATKGSTVSRSLLLRRHRRLLGLSYLPHQVTVTCPAWTSDTHPTIINPLFLLFTPTDNTTAILIGVFVPLGLILIVVLVVCICQRRKK